MRDDSSLQGSGGVSVPRGVRTVAVLRFPDTATCSRASRELSGVTHVGERELRLGFSLASAAIESCVKAAIRYRAHAGVATGEDESIDDRADMALKAADPGQVVACLSTVEIARTSLSGELRFVDLGVYESEDGAERARFFVLEPAGSTEPASLSVRRGIYIDRPRDLSNLRRLIDLSRLVTVLGPTGIGKSSLLHRFAIEVEDTFPDGTWLVDLSELADRRQVLPRICRALEVDRGEFERLLDALGAFVVGKQALLILDGTDRWTDAVAPVVTYLLSRANELQIVCAGTKCLRLPDEAVMRLKGLDTPSADLPASLLAESEAVSLFVSRAAMVDDSFQLDDTNAKWVAEVCRKLDGSPLAIQLAASKTNSLSPRQIHDRLDERLSLLRESADGVPSRHSSLIDALQWSVSLLSEDARKLLRRLGMMFGAFSVDTAVVVGADKTTLSASQAERAFDELVDSSILTPSLLKADERFFCLGETLRQYAFSLLKSVGEVEETKARRRKWAEELCRQSYAAINGSDHERWVMRLEAAYEDLRDIARRVARTDPEKAGWIAHACYTMLYRRGYFEEGIALFDDILRRPRAESCPSYARYLNVEATLYHALNRTREARVLAQHSLARAQERGDAVIESRALNTLGMIAYGQGRLCVARGCFLRSANLVRQDGNRNGYLISLVNYVAAIRSPLSPKQREIFDEAYRLAIELDNTVIQSILRHHLAELEVKFGSAEAALRCARDAFAIAARIPDPMACQRVARTLTKTFARLDRREEAIRWYGFAESLYRSNHDSMREDGDLLHELRLGDGFSQAEVSVLLSDGAGWEYEEAINQVNSTL